MNFLERILSRTPKQHKLVGKWCTFIGFVSASILSTGYVQNEFAIFVLTVISLVFGGKALYHAQKTHK